MRLAGEAAAMEYFDKRKPSYLPYYIMRHRRLARRRLLHARSKEHALKHVDIRIGCLALFWIIVFILVMTILIILLRDIIIAYISHPISTQILSENKVLPYPDVTICPVSPLSNDSSDQGYVEKLEELKRQAKQKLIYAGLHPNQPNVEAAMLIQLAMDRRKHYLKIRILLSFYPISSNDRTRILLLVNRRDYSSDRTIMKDNHLRNITCFNGSVAKKNEDE